MRRGASNWCGKWGAFFREFHWKFAKIMLNFVKHLHFFNIFRKNGSVAKNETKKGEKHSRVYFWRVHFGRVLGGHFGTKIRKKRFFGSSKSCLKCMSKKHRKMYKNQWFLPSKTLPKPFQNAFKIDVRKDMQFFIGFCSILFFVLLFDFLKILIFPKENQYF